MQREVIWQSDDGIGAEYLFLTERGTGIVADSIVFATRDVEPSRTRYRAEMGAQWHIRRVSLTVANAGDGERSLDLASDGVGHWRDGADTVLPEFDGCLDVDISATPFTNTLPVRRLNLQPGQVAPIRVLFIHVPSLRIEPSVQRYTGLTPETVRFESPGAGFQRDLSIDEDGLVIDYPGLFRRAWSG